MNKRKDFTKNSGAKPQKKVRLIALIAVVLSLAVLFALSGCQQEEQTPTTQATTAATTEGTVATTGAATTATEDTTTVETEPTETQPKETQPKETQPKETTPKENQPAVTTYTVTFKDHDGTVLKTEQVERGKAAEAPEVPARDGYKFDGWDKTFDKVTSNLVVTAKYTSTRPVIYVGSATVDKGAETVTISVRIRNNPGIMGAVLRITVDDQVFAFASGAKSQFPGLTLTSPGSGVTASPYTFMLDAMELSDSDRVDGTLFTVTFSIKDLEATGTFNVGLTCDGGSIFDENYADPGVALSGGTITIQ